MDLTLSGIVASFLVSSVGYVLFQYGRKCARTPQLVSGLALMVFPVFVPGVAWMLATAGAILAVLWVGLKTGFLS